jgi:hypothetical protein
MGLVEVHASSPDTHVNKKKILNSWKLVISLKILDVLLLR